MLDPREQNFLLALKTLVKQWHDSLVSRLCEDLGGIAPANLAEIPDFFGADELKKMPIKLIAEQVGVPLPQVSDMLDNRTKKHQLPCHVEESYLIIHNIENFFNKIDQLCNPSENQNKRTSNGEEETKEEGGAMLVNEVPPPSKIEEGDSIPQNAEEKIIQLLRDFHTLPKQYANQEFITDIILEEGVAPLRVEGCMALKLECGDVVQRKFKFYNEQLALLSKNSPKLTSYGWICGAGRVGIELKGKAAGIPLQVKIKLLFGMYQEPMRFGEQPAPEMYREFLIEQIYENSRSKAPPKQLSNKKDEIPEKDLNDGGLSNGNGEEKPFYKQKAFLTKFRKRLEEAEYTLGRRFKVGTNGIIYLAQDFFGKTRAIKIFKTPRARRQFHQEVTPLHEIDHENVVKLVRVGHVPYSGKKIYYYVMEFFEGSKSLKDVSLESLFEQSLAVRVKYALQLTNALIAIHQVYASHNDLHEGNVLLCPKTQNLKVIDPGASSVDLVGYSDKEFFERLISTYFLKPEDLVTLHLPNYETLTLEVIRESLNDFLKPESFNEQSRLPKEIPDTLPPEEQFQLFEYNGIELVKQDYQVLTALEKICGKAIPVEKVLRGLEAGYIIERNRVIQLCLSELELTQIPDIIGQLTALTELDLTSNKIKILPDSIGELRSLEILRMQSNKLIKLPNTIGNLASLRELDLWDNHLSLIPENIGELKCLTRFVLNENQLAAIPASIGDLQALQELLLDGNWITFIPKEIGKLSNLKKLGINGNRLEYLPGEIGNLGSLKELEIAQNQISELPQSIGKLSQLEKLFAVWNGINHLPEEIGGLTNLHRLDLLGNALSALPNAIGQLSALEFLNLDKNLLSCLPNSIENLKSLKYLGFCTNYFSEFPEVVSKLSGLEKLSFFKNKMRTIPESFGLLTSLKDLMMSNNQLESINPSFGKLNSLQELWIDENQLKIMAEIILKLTNLKSLKVETKDVEKFSQNFQQFMEKIKQFGCHIYPYSNEEKDRYTKASKIEKITLKEIENAYDPPCPIPELDHSPIDKAASFGYLLENDAVVELYLTYSPSKLRHIPDFIGNLSSLRRLDIGFDGCLFPQTIKELKNLKIFHISGGWNHQLVLPREIGDLRSLEEFSICGVLPCDSLPESMGTLSQLRRVYLDWIMSDIVIPNSLEKCPLLAEFRFIGSIHSKIKFRNWKGQTLPLKKLHLYDTNIGYIFPWILNLRDLVKLELEICKIERIPTTIGNLQNLRMLNLRKNEIAELPESIFSLKKLRILKLSHNQIVELPQSISSLKRLRILKLSHNKIAELPESLCEMESLEMIDVRFNPLNPGAQNTAILNTLKEKCRVKS